MGAHEARQTDEPARAGTGEVDVGFEVAGDDAALAVALRMVRPGGRVVVVGIPESDRTSFSAAGARRKGLTMLMSRRMKSGDLARAARMVDAGEVELRPLVTAARSLADWREAFDHLVRRSGLKAVIEPQAGGTS